MKEMYWITRLDGIIGASMVISIIFAIFGIIALFIWVTDYGNEDAKRPCLVFLSVATFFTLVSIFTPSTKEMLVIYGVGGTIDYVKQNETTKELPDKCVKALDMYLDKALEEKEE